MQVRRSNWSYLFSVALVLCLLVLLVACGGSSVSSDQATATASPTRHVATLPISPTSVPIPDGQKIYPQAGVNCSADFKDPALGKHPLNTVSCKNGTVTLGEGDTNLAEDDLVKPNTTMLTDYTLRVTLDLSQAGQTFGGVLLGTSEKCHCGMVLAVNSSGEWRVITDASAFDSGSISSTDYLSFHVASAQRVSIQVQRTSSALTLYANGKSVLVSDNLPPVGSFSFLALAPSGEQNPAHTIRFTGFEIWS